MTTRIELSYDETKKLVKNLMEYPLKKWKYSKKEKELGNPWVSHTRTAHSYSLSQSSRQVVVTDIKNNSRTLGFGRPEPDISHEYTLVVKSTEGEVNCESNGARTLFEYLTKLKTKLENRANSRARYNRNNLVKTVLDSL